VPGRNIINRFTYIIILTWLSVRVDFNILILILDTERKIAVEKEIELLNSMVGEPLYLTSTKINEGRD